MHHGNLLVIWLGVCVNTGLLFEVWLTCHNHPITKEVTTMTDASPRQDENGQPYLAYFDPDLHMAFMWSGQAESPIAVSTEGMNGPVDFEIPPTLNLGAIQSPAMLLREFRFVCNEWADTMHRADAELASIKGQS